MDTPTSLDGAAKSSASLPADLETLLSSILDKHDLSEVAITPYEVPAPTSPNPWTPFVLFFDDSCPPSSPRWKLAIPQKPLYKVYAAACKAFHALRLRRRDEKEQEEVDQEMLSATRLLLLQNPEHATALNERRRIILRSRSHGDDPVFRSRLAAEQRLVELLLEVPQHAKAWTLWHHLRWILSTLYPVDPSSVSSPTFAGAGVPSPSGAPALLPPLVAEAQFALALRCATIYPRNYYAWRHRLWLLAITTSTPSGNSASGSTADTLQEQYQTVSAFLRRNPRDHTAANYLAVVVKARSSIDPEASTPDAMALVNELIDRYPAVETPWLFARHLVSLEGPHAALSGLQGRSLRLLEAAQTGSKAQEGTLAGKEQDERSRAAVLGTRACLWAGMQTQALPAGSAIEDIRPILAGSAPPSSELERLSRLLHTTA